MFFLTEDRILVDQNTDQSICELQRIFDICERELMWLDMVINVKNLAACVLARETITQ